MKHDLIWLRRTIFPKSKQHAITMIIKNLIEFVLIHFFRRATVDFLNQISNTYCNRIILKRIKIITINTSYHSDRIHI
ncbi:hypothetical protein B5G16_06035 [Alistipes sp. An66]|nr:hypothetical protein B5G16_06035 [Alistipes sp. An66]